MLELPRKFSGAQVLDMRIALSCFHSYFALLSFTRMVSFMFADTKVLALLRFKSSLPIAIVST